MKHRDVTPPGIHAPWFYQEADPGAVGAHKVWVQPVPNISAPTSYQFKQRNATDTAWFLLLDTGSSSSTLQERTFTVTSSELLDLHNTPVELIPAPGVGKVVVPVTCAVVQYPGGGGGWSACGIRYSDPTQGHLGELGLRSGIDSAPLLAAAAATAMRIQSGAGVTNVENLAVVLWVGGPLTLSAPATISINQAGSGYTVSAPKEWVVIDGYNTALEVEAVDGNGGVTQIGRPGQLAPYFPPEGFYSDPLTNAPTTAGVGVGVGLTVDVTLLVGGELHGIISYYTFDVV